MNRARLVSQSGSSSYMFNYQNVSLSAVLTKKPYNSFLTSLTI